jgi:hypothetical protein
MPNMDNFSILARSAIIEVIRLQHQSCSINYESIGIGLFFSVAIFEVKKLDTDYFDGS